MSNVREWQKALMKRLGDSLKPAGFRVSGQSFLRPAVAGQGSIHLGFINHEQDFDVTVDVAVRIDAVEELVNASETLLTAREKAQTFTLGVELGNLTQGSQKRYSVASSDAIPPVAAEILVVVQEVAIPYIERVQSPAAAYDLLSRDDQDSWLHSPIHSARAKRALAVRTMVHVPESFDALVERKRDFLAARSDPMLPHFLRFASELRASPAFKHIAS